MRKPYPLALGLLASVIACQTGTANSYTYTTIDLSPPNSAVAADINNAGQVAGTQLVTGDTPGFLYNSDGSYTTFHAFNTAPGVFNTFVSGLNNVGQIIGFGLNNALDVGGGFLDTNGVFTPINFPGGFNTSPMGINDAGVIVGTYYAGGQIHGFIRSATGIYTDFQGISPLQAPISINNRGQLLVVTYTLPSGGFGFSTSAFLDTNGSFSPLPVEAGVGPVAPNKINNVGQVLYSAYGVAGGAGSGVLDANGSYTPISVPGDPYALSAGINDQGQVVGTQFKETPFVATPATAPEPRTLLLVAFGVLGIPIVRKLRVLKK